MIIMITVYRTPEPAGRESGVPGDCPEVAITKYAITDGCM